jgi:hypothetical protein
MDINVQELKKTLVEKEELKTRTELVYQQLLGQISLLKELIRTCEVENKKEVVPQE